ncbi:DUF1481 domain-containing protein [Vibrio viridaestus]|uniref:DUF1481 domain-containing protein n=1 Tax=Vibrio viridaestus TaxID=2487322 RepID=A0A3N9TDU8_9VIBR|nr:DUF1481 domain-containing protein [Vibrio viridaestus]RQW61695.1 DUF1481 domain-containing protein [Vibrio viridaestus]
MKQFIPSLILAFVLTACSSTNTSLDTAQIDRFSGGQRAGDSISLFWYTEKNSTAFQAADTVFSGEDGSYRSTYYWSQGKLQEILRYGEQRNTAGELVPFSVQIRFSQDGEAVFQRYRIDKKVLPLQAKQLDHYQQQAFDIAKMTREQNNKGKQLFQGIWNGETFESCKNREFTSIEFNQTLPSFVIQRLSSLNNYLAVLGRAKGSTLYIDELLIIDSDEHGCVVEPDLKQ